eukprot:GHUV01024681.1.p1 GENE.GHUV01024681.1~~GHUV01024681.1.p1  ORF type:complete len:205 (+),score=61.56 GHUV01024681.1:484-1098(+)
MHGTGTPLGDPIEVGAATSVLRPAGASTSSILTPLLMSGVKSDVGHAEPAAGVMGLARLMTQTMQASISPILHLRTINPYLHSALQGAAHTDSTANVQLPRQSFPWGTHSAGGAAVCSNSGFAMNSGRLLGGVSGFAFMGTNGHAMVAGPTLTANAGSGEKLLRAGDQLRQQVNYSQQCPSQRHAWLQLLHFIGMAQPWTGQHC